MVVCDSWESVKRGSVWAHGTEQATSWSWEVQAAGGPVRPGGCRRREAAGILGLLSPVVPLTFTPKI